MIYALNSSHELKRLTARFHWTVLDTGVRSFQVALNTDLYLLKENGELKRLKPGDYWNTLQRGVESFTIDFAGRVYALDGQQQLTMYANLPEGYYLLAPIVDASTHVASDPPDDDFILRAANIVPPSDQTFEPGPDFPFNREAAGEAIPPEITSPVTNAHNIRIVKEILADSIDPARIFRPGGPAQLHHAYYRCTIYYTTDLGTIQQRVIYIDKDHLHMAVNFESGTQN